MKKLLLSALAFVGLTAAATAADVTLNVNDATNINGTLVDEKPASGSDNGTAKHYAPLQGLEINGYSFSFTKGDASSDPAYYYNMSTSQNTQNTIRLYKKSGKKETGNTMTIVAPAGSSFASIVFTGSNGTKGTNCVASVGTAKITEGTKMEWSNATAVSEVTITMTDSQFRIMEMTISSEPGSVTPGPEPTEGVFQKVSTLESGKYVMVVMQDGESKLVRPYIGDRNYGRWNVTDITLNGDELTTDEANAFVFTVADGKVTVKDNTEAVRYYGMDSQHLSSFQFYETANEGCYYTYEFVNGELKLTNALNTNCIVCQSKGDQGTWYTNVAPAKDPTEYNLPILFKAKTNAIENVEAAAANDAPVVYYNLQGVRVANPENGLYIRVQGNKAVKVAL